MENEHRCPMCGATDNNSYTTASGVKMRACNRCILRWRDESEPTSDTLVDMSEEMAIKHYDLKISENQLKIAEIEQKRAERELKFFWLKFVMDAIKVLIWLALTIAFLIALFSDDWVRIKIW